MPVIIKIKRGTTSQWSSSTIPLQSGELGYDAQAKIIKIGDGSTLWESLLPLNKFEIDEISQDAIYDALTNFIGISNNITVTYNDAENYIVLDTGPNVVLQSDLTTAISSANDYTDTAVSSLGNSIDEQYVPISDVGNLNGVAPLDSNSLIPDQYIPSGIARDSEIITSYNDLTDTPVLSTVATSGSYSDLLNLPNLFNGDYDNLFNTPTLFSGSYSDLTNKPNIALAAVQWTANHYQLPGGANTRYLAGDIVYDGGSIFVANFDNESLPTTNTQYWTNIGAGNRLNIDGRDIPNIIWDNILNKPTLFSGSYTDLTDKPTLFSGSYNDLTDKPTIPSLTGYATETYVGTAVSNLVDSAPETLNTLNELAAALGDDANYATTISTALGNKLDSATASSTYAPLASPTFTGTVAGITKSMVGLGNVDNTSDLNKPVSTATQTALSSKLSISEPSVDYYITNVGAGSYMVNGVSNGLITFSKGKKYRIVVNASGHPFWIQTVSGGYSSANVYNTGITNNGTQDGSIIVELTDSAPNNLYYACQYHSSMAGAIAVNTEGASTPNTVSDTAYTPIISDMSRTIITTATSQVTITIPPDSETNFPLGTSLSVLQDGSGQVVFTAGLGVTLNTLGNSGALKNRYRYAISGVYKYAANTWVALGDLIV